MIRGIFLILFLSTSAWAHKAHVHGEGTLGLAFDGAKGKLLLEIPGESVVGFEYRPQKPADMNKQKKTLSLFESMISEMVIFPVDLKCHFKKNKLEMSYHEGHGEMVGEFNVQCAQSLRGQTLEFKFSDKWPRIKKIKADILVDDLQKSIEITGSGAKLELK